MTRAKDVLAKHLEDKPAIGRWMKDLAARPGVRRGMAIDPPPTGDEPTEQAEKETNS